VRLEQDGRQTLAGHGHLSVTQRYAHTRDERLRQAVQIFG